MGLSAGLPIIRYDIDRIGVRFAQSLEAVDPVAATLARLDDVFLMVHGAADETVRVSHDPPDPRTQIRLRTSVMPVFHPYVDLKQWAMLREQGSGSADHAPVTAGASLHWAMFARKDFEVQWASANDSEHDLQGCSRQVRRG